MASFAAIFAIGKPVAFDASALDRETRGFISMTTSRPSAGLTANWMLQPPVSTPTSRSTAMPTSRIRWYSRSVRVIAGALLGDDLLDELGGQRLDVRGVGDLRVGHDRRRVAVDQADPQPLGPEHPAGLRPGVVELGGLADEDRPRADHHHVVDVVPSGHQALFSAVLCSTSGGGPPACPSPVRAVSMRSTNRWNSGAASCGPAAASGWNCTLNAGRSRQRSPSTTSSLRPTWLTSTCPYGVSVARSSGA